MRVGFVAWRELDHPQAGGSEVVVDRLLRGLADRGHEVRLMCGGPVGRRPYPIDDLGGEFTQYLRAPLVHARHFRGADVLIDVQNGIPFFSPLWRRKPSVCLVHHVHTDQWRLRFPEPVAAFGRALEGRAMPWVYRDSHYVAVSPGTAAGLRELGIPGDRVNVVTNGVEASERTAARAPEPRFLALGRLVPHKRIDLLLRMWERVRPHTGGCLVLAGDGPEMHAIRAIAGEGVELRGAVSHAEKERLLSSSWMLVHPALHEGWGMVVLEAAMMQTPTLAFDVPGVRDTVRDGATGTLVRDEDEFVGRWIALAADPVLRQRLGSAARSWAEGFTWERSIDRLEALLLDVTGRSSVTGAPSDGFAVPA